MQRHEARDPAGQPYAIQHACVGRVGEHDLVTGIGQAEERVEHRVALAARDHDLAEPVVGRASAPLDLRSHRLFEVVAAGERQPAVRVVLADGGPRRLDHGHVGRDVGVEVLEAQDVGIVARGGGDAIDAEAGDVGEAADAHRGRTRRGAERSAR